MNKKVRRRKIKYFYKLAEDFYKKDEDAFKDVDLDPSNIYDPRTKRKYVKTPIPGKEEWHLDEEDRKIRDNYGYEEFTIGEEKYRLYKLLDFEANAMFEVSTGDEWRYEIPEVNYRTFGEYCFNKDGTNTAKKCYRYHKNKTEKCVDEKFENAKEKYLEKRQAAAREYNSALKTQRARLKQEAEKDFPTLRESDEWESRRTVNFPVVTGVSGYISVELDKDTTLQTENPFDGTPISVADPEDLYQYYLIYSSISDGGVLKKLNDNWSKSYEDNEDYWKFIPPYGLGYMNDPYRDAFLEELKKECESELNVKDEPAARGGLAGSSDYISPGFMYNLGNGFYYIRKEDLSEDFYGDADYVIFYNDGMFSKNLNNVKKDFIVWNYHNPKIVYSKDKIPDKNPNLLNFWNKIRGFEDYDPEDAAKIEYRVPRPEFGPLEPPTSDWCENPDNFSDQYYTMYCPNLKEGVPEPPGEIGFCERFPNHPNCPKLREGLPNRDTYDHGELDDPKRRKRKSRWVEFCKLNPDHPNCIKYKKTNYNNIYTEDDDLPIRDTKRTNPFKTPYDPKKYRKWKKWIKK